MKMAQVVGRRGAEDVARFAEAVRRDLPGAARRKAEGCRTGHFVVREEALDAFTALARVHGVEVYVYAQEELERPAQRFNR